MKLFVVILFAALLAVVSAVDYDGFAVMPYCFNVTNGQFNLNGDVVLFDTIQIWGPSNAIFVNGLNLGLDSNAYWAHDVHRNASFLLADGQNTNGTNNPFLYKAAYWDFGIAGDQFAYGLGDGTWDTVDLAMVFAFNFTTLPFINTNLSIYCSSYGVEVHNDNTINELEVVQHFYAAKWQYDSWGRVVAVVKNPTNADISVTLGFNNNVGADGDTSYIVSNPRYVVIADALNDTALQAYYDGFGDNPISMHWLSKDTSYPAPSLSNTWGVDDINSHWDVTIKAGETQSFMMILVQNRLVLQEAIDNATYIDSNPIKIYDTASMYRIGRGVNAVVGLNTILMSLLLSGLSSDVLSTLKNFNACAASAPSVTVSETSSCTSFGGSATLTIADYDLSFALVLVDSTGTQHSVVNNMVSAPSGDYALVLQLYPGCEHVLHTGTVTCPAAPTAAPKATTKTSSSSRYEIAAILMLMLSLVYLL